MPDGNERTCDHGVPLSEPCEACSNDAKAALWEDRDEW